METIDDLKVELSEDGNCRITIITAADMAFLIKELIEDGRLNKNIIEEMILNKYNEYYQICPPDDYDDTYDDEYWSSLIDSNELDGYLETKRDYEIMENDKRVIKQYNINFGIPGWKEAC